MDPWPHQQFATEETERVMQDCARTLLTTPTGGGKTLIAAMKIKQWRQQGHRVGLYTNRRLLVEQLSRMLKEYGIEHGIRQSGKKAKYSEPVQIISVQTEGAKTRKARAENATHFLHDAKRILVDEAHLNAGPGMLAIMEQHIQEGAKILGMTATPIDLGHCYDELVQAGLTSDLRECGALVPAIHFGPDEPDLKAFSRAKKKLANIMQDGAQLTEGQVVELFPLKPELFGRVWEWFEKLNPDHEPTILFAPDVKGSLWFAEQFTRMGVTAAHIDGSSIWRSGWDEPQRTNPNIRREILEASRDRRIVVLCNRFVLREGIDAPWLSHGIFATVFGSLQTYLQSGGRLLRSHDNVPLVRIQDHGGNWWRWGSLNADRHWNLSDTGTGLAQRRADQLRDKKQGEPFRCPECARIVIAGKCIGCGWQPGSWIKSRPVVSTDGQLRMMHGDIYRPHNICKAEWGPAKWERIFWASYKNKKDRTFRNATVLFAMDSHWQWPDPTWPFMPIDPNDQYRPIADVPLSRLIPKEVDGGKEAKEPEAKQGGFFRQWEQAGYYDGQEAS